MNRIWKHRMLATWMPKTLLLLAGAVLMTACDGGVGGAPTKINQTSAPPTQPVVSNQGPVANAGANFEAVGGTTVTLDGSGSRDPENRIVAYAWTQVSPAMPTLTLANADAAVATFAAPAVTEDATFEFGLTVTDIHGVAAMANVTVTITNTPPVANPGSAQTAMPNAVVTLDGSGSNDPGGGAITTYEWTQLSPATPTVEITNADQAKATFTAPVVTENTPFEFGLKVTDAGGLTHTQEVTITISGTAPDTEPSARLMAEATSETLLVVSGTVVTLDGSDSSAPGGGAITYEWTQLSPAMPAIELTNDDMAMATFTAPDIITNTTFEFQLTVTDGNTPPATAMDTVSIKVYLQPTATAALAMAGAGGAAVAGTMVMLTGANPGGGNVTYSWTQETGPTVSLTGGNTATATFTAPEGLTDSTLRFKLTVTDTDDNTTIETMVSVEVNKIDLSELRGVSVSDDGTRAVTGGVDGKVRLWDVDTTTATATEITFGTSDDERSLGSHHGPVYAVAISGDGTRAISGGHDGAVKLWNTDATDTDATNADGVYGDEIRYGVTNDNPGRSLRDGGIWVYAVTLNHLGTRAASGGFDGRVRLWNTDAGDAMDDANGMHGEEILFGTTPNVRSLGSHSEEIMEDTFGYTATTPGIADHTSDDATYTTYYSVYAVSMNRDGTRVLSGAADGTVRVWNATTGLQLGTGLTDGGEMAGMIMGPIYGVALSDDGQMAVAGGADNKVRVWDIGENGMGTTESRELITHTADVSSVSLNANKTRLVSVGGDGYVRFWTLGATSADDRETARRLHTDYVWSVSLNGLGTTALSVDADGLLGIWDTGSLPSDTTEPFSSTMETDEDHATTDDMVRNDDVVRQELFRDTVQDEATGDITEGMRTAHSGNVLGVALSADGKFAMTVGRVVADNADPTSEVKARFWDVSAGLGTPVVGSPLMDMPLSGSISAAALSGDGRVAMLGEGTGASLWERETDPETGAEAWTQINTEPLVDADSVSALATSVQLTPDGRLGISSSDHRHPAIWNVATGTSVATSRVATLSGHNSDQVAGAAISADGGTAATSGEGDRTVRLWKRGDDGWVKDGDNISGILRTHANTVFGVALSADGRYVLSASHDDTARFYQWEDDDTATNINERLSVTRSVELAHTYDLIDAALSADGRLAVLAEGGQTAAVVLWDTTGEGTVLRIMGDHSHQGNSEAAVNSISVSADGLTAISGGVDDKVFLWHLGGSRTIRTPFVATAEAGPDQGGEGQPAVNPTDMVTLDGSDSTDTSGEPLLAYYWRQVPTGETALSATNTATLSADNTAMVTFAAPSATETLTFVLTVTDAQGMIATDTVTVTITAPASSGTAQ